MNWTVIGELLPKSFGVAVSPMPIVLVMLMLVSARARTNGPAYMVGWIVGCFTLPFLVYLLSDGASVGADDTADKGANIVQIALGVLFLWFAWTQWKSRPRAGEEPPLPRLFAGVDAMGIGMAFGIGAAFAMLNAKNTPIGISVGVGLAQAGVPTPQAISSLVVYALVGASTVIVPVVAVLLLGDSVRGALDTMRDWLVANNSTIMTVLFGFLGTKMLGNGLAVFG